jgi:dUTP pyrophosphatase
VETIAIKIKKLAHYDASFELPFYATKDAAGADIRASFPEKKNFTIKPGQRALIPTGLSMEIPAGYEVQVRPRSGLSLKSPLMIVNSPGTIDADYRGEVCIIVGNFGTEDYVIEHGLRVAQLIVCPVYQGHYTEVGDLSVTARGSGGFGSTGQR